MTTPEVEIVMPYGVTLEGDGARDAKIVGSHPQAAGDVYLNIPSGPCRIGFSWEGPEEMRCYVANRGPGMLRFVGSLPAKSGGGVRSRVVTVGAVEGDMVKLYSPTGTTAGARGTLEVFPLVSQF